MILFASLEWFSLTVLGARSNVVKIFQKKNRTSNRSKPMTVLTRANCSCNDDHLPNGYLLPDFQPSWRNFVNRFTSLPFSLTRQEGGPREKKKNSHKSFDSITLALYDQTTCYVISNLIKTKKCSKMRFKSIYH